MVAYRRFRLNRARRSRERAGGLERPPASHCAAEETSQAFDDVGMKWQKLFLLRKRRDSVTKKLDIDSIYHVCDLLAWVEVGVCVEREKGFRLPFFLKNKRPGCVSSEQRLRVDSVGIKQRG